MHSIHILSKREMTFDAISSTSRLETLLLVVAHEALFHVVTNRTRTWNLFVLHHYPGNLFKPLSP
jgi:hypothetical protein